jgi:predicted outer membrane protein
MRPRFASLVAVALIAVAAQADPTGEAPTPPKNGAPDVGLDSLLRLPPTVSPATEPRAGGATKPEWQQRFAAARGDVEAAHQAIDKAQDELGKLARGTDSWQMSAPGAQAGTQTETSPMSYKLRQELRNQREELANAERRLTDLEVEANLAGVPEEWTRPQGEAPPKPAAAH